MKKILAINYSQSGQLSEIVDNLISEFTDIDVDRINVEMQNDFPFPWTPKVFYNAMPESVLKIPAPIKPLNFKHENYDLILIGYQPWYLSPSIPTTSFLNDAGFQKRLKGTKVITLIAGRNMWLTSQESVVATIESAGGEMVGNLPFVDRTSNLISVITILHWMLTGKKTKKYGIFPKPGVADEEIDTSSKFTPLIQDALLADDYIGLQEKIIKTGKFSVLTTVMFIESRAKMLFQVWAKLIKKKEAKSQQSREKWLNVLT